MLVSNRFQRKLTYGIALTSMLGISYAGWSHIAPANAQGSAPALDPTQAPVAPYMGMRGPAAIAASGDYVYVLRGNTLFQMKSSDLSLSAQKDLPAPSAPAPAAPAGQ